MLDIHPSGSMFEISNTMSLKTISHVQGLIWETIRRRKPQSHHESLSTFGFANHRFFYYQPPWILTSRFLIFGVNNPPEYVYHHSGSRASIQFEQSCVLLEWPRHCVTHFRSSTNAPYSITQQASRSFQRLEVNTGSYRENPSSWAGAGAGCFEEL